MATCVTDHLAAILTVAPGSENCKFPILYTSAVHALTW